MRVWIAVAVLVAAAAAAALWAAFMADLRSNVPDVAVETVINELQATPTPTLTPTPTEASP